ncbi:MAG TPA: PAS domain S-box protein [Thermodesulfobacteriota bacterium]|nr:PAS domain S-box protein [Thermodesulfobacteriota bacterium]
MSDLYDLLLQQIQEIVYAVKINGDHLLGSVQFFSNRTGPMLGFDPQEFMDNPNLWFSIIHPDDLDNVKMTTHSMLETGKPVTRTYRIRHKTTSEYFWIEDKASPQCDDTGNIVGYIGAAQDITDRKQAEYALQASEVRYRRLFETAQDGILILDAETGQITDVNPFLVEMLGFSHETFLGKKLWEIGLFRDVAASQKGFTKLQKHGYIRYEDLPLETHDGRKIQVEFVSNVYEVNHSKVIQCNIRDITKRKWAEYALQASEVRYRRLFESARDGILILDAETGQITDVNPFLVEMLGLSRETLLGKKLWEIVSFKDGAATKAAFGTLQEQGYIRYEDLPLKTIDGRKIQVEFVSNVYEVNQSKVIQCNIRDITDRKQAEAEREKLIHELEAALAKVKTLSGMLPICASCKRIRNDEGYWSQIEAYISQHSTVSFSHGLCPECAHKLYPDIFKNGDKDFSTKT